DEIRAAVADESDYRQADAAYGKAFREYGIDPDVLDAADAARRVRTVAIAVPLALALDDWAFGRRELHRRGAGAVWYAESPDVRRARLAEPVPEADRLVAVARAVDADPWRARLRDA